MSDEEKLQSVVLNTDKKMKAGYSGIIALTGHAVFVAAAIHAGMAGLLWYAGIFILAGCCSLMASMGLELAALYHNVLAAMVKAMKDGIEESEDDGPPKDGE